MKIYTKDRFYSLKDYQELKGLKDDMVAKYFSINEHAIKASTLISADLLTLLDAIREAKGKPVKLNSLHRTIAKQNELKEAGYSTAGHSPHLYGAAADIDCDSAFEVKAMARLAKDEANKLGLEVRIGYKEYLERGQTFVHIDIMPSLIKNIFDFIPFLPDAFKKSIVW
jgi:uncharacterized protein YcbK (DUF882 family)